MNFLILGGGCYGSFYTRQLLRGAERIGLGKIDVVDINPRCQVMQEFGKHPHIRYHFQDWKEFLLSYFDEQLKSYQRGEFITDHYAPPCLAPHILFELFLDYARRGNPRLNFKNIPFELSVGTPLDMSLPAGTRALSFATWTCPHSCIEPPTCPHTRGPKHWDMKEYLTKYFGEGALKLSIHLFQCRHYAMGVGTIPMKEIIEEYLQFQRVTSVPGTQLSALATISSCHGLVGLVESTYV